MGVRGFKTNRGDTGTVLAREFKAERLGARRRISSTATALPGRQPETGAPGPHWSGKLLGSAIVRPDRYRDPGFGQ